MRKLAMRWTSVVALLAVGCGETVILDETFEIVAAKQDGGPHITIGATRNRERTGILSERVSTGGPYTVGFGEQYEDATRPPFRITALVVEQDGVAILTQTASDPPLEAKPRENTDPAKPTMIASVPLPDLQFAPDAKVSVRAKVEVDGESSVQLDRSFVGRRAEKSYQGCDRIAMY